MDTKTNGQLSDALNGAYNQLKTAVFQQSEAMQRYDDAKIALELAKAAKYISGEIQGKNETERKASEATLLANEIDAVKSAERQLQLRGLDTRLAEIETERVRWKIRLELGTSDAQSPAKEPEPDLPF